MKQYESFGACLKRCLKENGLSASEVAKLVGFRSRNSMFRILSGEAGDDVRLRFLGKLHEVLGEAWPDEQWYELQESLSVERLGVERYEANRAFTRILQAEETTEDYTAHYRAQEDEESRIPLKQILAKVSRADKTEIIITGCCDSGISRLIAECCSDAASRGKLTVRHYIDISENVVTQNILGILPLVSKPWYNAHLVDPGSCPPEMMAVYRLHCIHIQCWDEKGSPYWNILVRYDRNNFTCQDWMAGICPAVTVVDRWRFSLELLKPLTKPGEGTASFVAYTEQYAGLEENCAILSIKPDVHFNCIPANLLEQAVLEGFEQSGMAAGEDLLQLVGQLKCVHNRRVDNMLTKRRATHLVYSLKEMEQFMRTGVLTDQFFIQRAYTVEERRLIIRVLLDAMDQNPYFHVHFIKKDAIIPRYEITLYEGKGVLLMDAYTGYDLGRDHSEALITLPSFAASFRSYFMDELLPHYGYQKAEVKGILKGLLVMDIQE